MTRILLVGNSPEFAARLSDATAGAYLEVRPNPFPATPQELFPLLNGAPKPDLALLEPGESVEDALALATSLVRDYGVNVMLGDRPGSDDRAACPARGSAGRS